MTLFELTDTGAAGARAFMPLDRGSGATLSATVFVDRDIAAARAAMAGYPGLLGSSAVRCANVLAVRDGNASRDGRRRVAAALRILCRGWGKRIGHS